MPVTERFIEKLRREFSLPESTPITEETDFYTLIGSGRETTLRALQESLASQIGTMPDRAEEFFTKGMTESYIGPEPNTDCGKPNTVGRLAAMIEYIHDRALPDNGSG